MKKKDLGAPAAQSKASHSAECGGQPAGGRCICGVGFERRCFCGEQIDAKPRTSRSHAVPSRRKYCSRECAAYMAHKRQGQRIFGTPDGLAKDALKDTP